MRPTSMIAKARYFKINSEFLRFRFFVRMWNAYIWLVKVSDSLKFMFFFSFFFLLEENEGKELISARNIVRCNQKIRKIS